MSASKSPCFESYLYIGFAAGCVFREVEEVFSEGKTEYKYSDQTADTSAGLTITPLAAVTVASMLALFV